MSDCICILCIPRIPGFGEYWLDPVDRDYRVHHEHPDAEADFERIRAELRDRLDRCTDHDHGLAFGWLADNHPDLVREALDETGAPS